MEEQEMMPMINELNCSKYFDITKYPTLKGQEVEDVSSYRFLTMLVDYPLGSSPSKQDVEKFLLQVKEILESDNFDKMLDTPAMITFVCYDRVEDKYVMPDGRRAIMGPTDHLDESITPKENIDGRVGLLFYFTSKRSVQELKDIYGEEKFSSEGAMPKKWL